MARRAIIVADLGFGDAGKGTMVDYLVRQARSSLVVRYNGGPQAAHNVIAPNGKHHVFSQFGAGHLQLKSRTHLSNYMLVNPFNLYEEARHLDELGVKAVWERLSVDGRAIVITPWHQAANRLREIGRGQGRHGSCGQGVGEARWDDIRFPELTLRPSDFYSPRKLRGKLQEVRDRKFEELQPLFAELEFSEEVLRERQLFLRPDLIDSCMEFYKHFAWLTRIVGEDFLERELKIYEQVVFEGAQGVLLDEKYGFHPYTTWSNTTFDNALDLLETSRYDGDVTKLGVIRGYAVRHGAGPFVTEDEELTSGLPEIHNVTNNWQEHFRIGYPDLLALRYAIEVCRGVDALAVTGLDRMFGREWQVADGYQIPPDQARWLFDIDEQSVSRRMRVVRGNNRQHMIELTELLKTAKPVYQQLDTPAGNGQFRSRQDTEAYLDFLAQELDVAVSHASYGPTAADKQELTKVLADVRS